MKISPINEMMPAYRDIKPVDNREIEIQIEKVGAGAEPKGLEPAKDQPAVKPEINDGRETIGVSRDGDQARASREAMESISEGLVMRKPVEVRPEDAEKAGRTGNEDKADPGKVSSLLSYSKDELERLYLQGEINSNQLDKELERREEVRGEKNDARMAEINDEKEEKETNEEAARTMEDRREYGVNEVTKRDNEVVSTNKEISDKRANEAAVQNEEERDEANENPTVTNEADENRKRIITEEMGLDNEFIEKMEVLASAEENDRITSEALDRAVENGRLKVMQEVLGVDPATASEV
ncbi:MAG TPA: hypothetical protein DIS78_03165 [Lachnospiraceae bacterium]|nr:hypothetical protein [Lachnospiraceae bacterium]